MPQYSGLRMVSIFPRRPYRCKTSLAGACISRLFGTWSEVSLNHGLFFRVSGLWFRALRLEWLRVLVAQSRICKRTISMQAYDRGLGQVLGESRRLLSYKDCNEVILLRCSELFVLSWLFFWVLSTFAVQTHEFLCV